MSSEVEKSDYIKIDPSMLYRYAPETLDEDDDDGTMPNNVETLANAVIGRKIVSAEQGPIPGLDTRRYWGATSGLILTLDDGTRVVLADSDDCCAYTSLNNFLLHVDKIQHAITGVGTEEGYTKWHIYADYGDILDLELGWSCGNPFYYGYGFDISVIPMSPVAAIEMPTV